MNEKNKTKEKEVFIALAILVLFFAAIMFWHPWINQSSAQDAFEEFYGTNIYKVKLTQWNPFGHEFEVYNGEVFVGKGLINLWGNIIEFQFLWQD